jgi:AraC-like DNA-binding protein
MLIVDPEAFRNGGLPPLARHRLVDTDDPRRAHAEAVRLFAPHKLETPKRGAFSAQIHHHRLETLSLYFIRYRPEVVISSGPMKRFYLLLAPLAGACHVTQALHAMRLVPGTFGIVNPWQPISLRWVEGCAQLVVKLDRQRLEAALARQLGAAAAVAPLEFGPEPVAHAAAPGLMRVLDLVFRDLDRARPVLAGGEDEGAAETLIHDFVLGEAPNSYSHALERPASRAAPYYVRRAEEYIRLHAAEALRLKDVVAVAGVSARALFQGFKDFRGLGPMAYLKAVRLEFARQDLAGSERSRSVTETAAAWGFRHPGRFAHDYRRRFGELPSATRRKRRR